MSKQETELTHIVSEGGIAAKHLPIEDLVALVGPATGSEHNTIKAAIIPIACWRLEDIRFEFDSSIVRPEIKTDLESLARLVNEHPPLSQAEKLQPPQLGCPLSVFGHADPTGNDDYNKQLSGRRATAIYALITRRTELWEKLFSQPLGNDKWGRRALEMMLDSVSTETEERAGDQNSPATTKGAQGQQTGKGKSPTSGQRREDEVAQHESDVGKRKQLFLKYMEQLCGPELKLEKQDFLARGEDTGGKGDFQGCSEFNPVLISSQEDQKKFEQDKDKTERNAANASNRRVMVLIFRKGSRVDPSKWPCPRANEGVAGCRKRFFSDGEKRRSTRSPDKPRKFEETKDTFACRFYNRLATNSPCEAIIGGVHISVLLCSNSGAVPLANLPYRVFADRVLEGTTDKDGLIQHDSVPPGDYELELDGKRAQTLVPTMPRHFSRRTLRIEDFFLFEDREPDTLPLQDPNKSIFVRDTRDEDGWKVVKGG